MGRLFVNKLALFTGASVLVLGVGFSVFAQSKPPQAPAKPAAPAQNAGAQAAGAPASAPAASSTPTGGWIARCSSPTRQAPLECVLEQQVIVQATGQQISLVSVRVPGDTRQPVMMVQLPLGLYLPAGLNLQVDEGKAQAIAIQSCDQRACYVGLPISGEFLDGLRKGQRLNLAMQSLNREPVTIVHPLADFSNQYQKIQ